VLALLLSPGSRRGFFHSGWLVCSRYEGRYRRMNQAKKTAASVRHIATVAAEPSSEGRNIGSL
jgi:hypothetical protein